MIGLRDLQNLLDSLDKEHEKRLAERQMPTENKAAVYDAAGKGMLEELDYLSKRGELLEMIKSATPVSPAVADFINPPQEHSKFDVDSGKAEIDNSLNPLGGKRL